jgi:hypothetical protein
VTEWQLQESTALAIIDPRRKIALKELEAEDLTRFTGLTGHEG